MIDDLALGNSVENMHHHEYRDAVYPEAHSSPAAPNASSFPSEPSAVEPILPKCTRRREPKSTRRREPKSNRPRVPICTDFSLMQMDDRQIRSICHRHEGRGIGFSDIAKGLNVSGEAVRCRFMAACKDLIFKLKSPMLRPHALDAYDDAMRLAKQPVLG